MEVMMYSRNDCGYCVRAKILLEKNGLDYTELKLDQDFTRAEVRALYPTMETFPVILINGQLIGGHDDLVKWMKNYDPDTGSYNG